MEKRFEFKYDDHGDHIDISNYDLIEITTICCSLIAQIYDRLGATNPDIAEAFRKMVVHGVSDPASPIFRPGAGNGLGDGVSICVMKSKEEIS